MAYPKIVYNSGTTLSFTFPPVSKPGSDEVLSDRMDSITFSGKKQSVWGRNDKLIVLNMDYVPVADMPGWQTFVEWALQGDSFDYYPDSGSSTHVSVTLDDTDFKPKYNFKNMAKFVITLRKN